MVDDGRSAAVRFAAGGKQYHYDMSLFSVYSEGAEAIAVTDGKAEYLDIDDSQTFSSRIDGRWASALLHDNGSVSGVFEHDGEFIELQPSDSASLLAVTEGNSSNVHQVWYHAFEDLTVPSGDLMNTSLLEMGKPRIIRDDPVVDEDGVEHMFHIPAGADAPHDEYGPKAKKGEDGATGGTKMSRLVKWTPGCYSGDRAPHVVMLTVVADYPAYEKYGSKVKKMLERDVAEASLVYEKQMNIKLKVGNLKYYKSRSGAPRYAAGCERKNFMDKKLDQVSPWGSTQDQNAALALFTGCGDGGGTVGIAWYGTLCKKNNAHINQFQTQDGSGSWLTFAHELGHNFHADHSFEEGMYKTGGIMDYADGKLNGVYQFNTRYRKKEVCRYLARVAGKCRGKFAKSGDERDDPSPTPSGNNNNDSPSPFSPSPSGGGKGKGGKGGGGGGSPSPFSPSPSGGGKGKGGGSPSPVSSPSPFSPSPSGGGKGKGKGGGGGSPSPVSSPSPFSPSPSGGGKGKGKGQVVSGDNDDSPTPSPPPEEEEEEDSRRRRRRRRRRRSD
jgi:hypothetical protein